MPQLAMPSLASAASEAVDSATLTRAALEERRKEEMKEKEAQKVKREERAANRELDTLLLAPSIAARTRRTTGLWSFGRCWTASAGTEL